MKEKISNSKVKLEFLVKDTGIGIPEDKTDDLFESFCQVDNSNTRQYGGTGLGLTISKRLVELMEGEIWVESKEGKGSSFYFTCVLEKSEEKDNTRATEVNIKNGIKEDVLTLLIVEDNQVSRMVIEKFAIRKGWRVVLAENGKVAIDKYQENGCDAILMDVQLPILDGYKATGVIRQLEIQKGTHTPIIAMTAHRPCLKGRQRKMPGIRYG